MYYSVVCVCVSISMCVLLLFYYYYYLSILPSYYSSIDYYCVDSMMKPVIGILIDILNVCGNSIIIE